MLSRILAIVLFMAAIPAAPAASASPDSVATAEDGASGDSTLVFRYGVLYESRIDLERSSGLFPWNDPATDSHMSDRLSLMAVVALPRNAEIFIKGATGARAPDRLFYRERFALDQGHISYRAESMGLEGRLFLRERIYRSGFLLLPLVTAERPFTSVRGEGFMLEVERWGIFGLRYIESALRDDPRIDDYGGLPLFTGGSDIFRHLEAGIRGYRGLRFELAASQIRSFDYGDVVTLASGFGVGLLGLRLDIEMARSIEGNWEDAANSRLFELDFDRIDTGDASALFGEHVAFSGELGGLVYRSRSLGTLHALPGYRYCGRNFINPAGETAYPIVESYITTWWTHPELELFVTLGARDRYETLEGCEHRLLEGSARMRLRGGFAARGGILYEADHRPSLIMSLEDENSDYRLALSVRLDDAGREDDFSFLAEGALNMTGSVSVRSTLLLVRSRESFYHLGIEFRPTRKFLLDLGFGSFRPFDEDISFHHDGLIVPPTKNRMVILSTRVWLGAL
jgi:hypothetical protein